MPPGVWWTRHRIRRMWSLQMGTAPKALQIRQTSGFWDRQDQRRVRVELVGCLLSRIQKCYTPPQFECRCRCNSRFRECTLPWQKRPLPNLWQGTKTQPDLSAEAWITGWKVRLEQPAAQKDADSIHTFDSSDRCFGCAWSAQFEYSSPRLKCTIQGSTLLGVATIARGAFSDPCSLRCHRFRRCICGPHLLGAILCFSHSVTLRTRQRRRSALRFGRGR